MKKIIIAIMIFVIAVVVVIGVAIGGNSNNGSNDFNSEIVLVQDSMTAVSPDKIYAWEYEAGVLEDGIAVLVNDNGAYWVKDNVVYAANGFAKTWSPNLDYSPTGIDFDTVQNSVKN